MTKMNKDIEETFLFTENYSHIQLGFWGFGGQLLSQDLNIYIHIHTHTHKHTLTQTHTHTHI